MVASYPAAIKSFDQEVNKGTLADADDFNAVTDEVSAIETELGTDPAGSHSDVKTRLGQEAAAFWVATDYGAGVPADDDSFNVSSLDDDGVGIIGVNFTNNMSQADYIICVTGGRTGGGGDFTGSGATAATTDCQIQLRNGGSAADIAGSIIGFGDH